MKTYASVSEKEKLEIHKNPREYLHLPDLPLELVKEVLLSSPVKYLQIPNPSREVTLFLVRSDGYNLSLISKDNQDEEICIEAVKEWWSAMRHVKIDFTEEISKACILSFLKSIMSHDLRLSLQVDVIRDIPDKILKSDSFRRFLIDHGLFEFLR